MGRLHPFRPRPSGSPGIPARLESWKEIATYLKRAPRTVQRWEAEEGLPVHRLHHAKGDSVFALTEELDAWVEGRPQLVQEDRSTPAVVPPSRDQRMKRRFLRRLAVAAGVAAIAISAAWSLWRYSRVQWALEEARPEIRRLLDAGDFWSAYRLAQAAQRYIPADPDVVEAATAGLANVSIHTEPEGAEIYVKSYAAPESDWDRLGVTPLEDVPISLTLLRWKISRDGFDEVQGGFDLVFTPKIVVPLTPAGTGPPGMVFAPKSRRGSHSFEELGDFWIDRYEVTNRRYREFVDAGGYRERKYWKHPFVREGEEIPWKEAMAFFRDKTGRRGPATWALGAYPEEQDDYPVSGVSWYEAAAYAEWAGKSLPTIHHWYKAAGLGLYSDILRFSNLQGQGPWKAGNSVDMGPYGTHDMAGNVREWCWSLAGGARRFINGGAWNEPVSMLRYTDAQPPFDRLETYGFRCVRYLSPPAPELLAPVVEAAPEAERAALEPIDDEAFDLIREVYSYHPADLNAKVETVDDSNQHWRVETVTFDAAYGDERVIAHLLLPKNTKPPYQIVLYCPTGGSTIWPSSRDWIETSLWIWSFIVRTGRAMMFPVWKGAFERRVRSGNSGPSTPADRIIAQTKDLGRSLDYLATREDIDSEKIGYYGFSGTTIRWPICGAIEKRIKTAVLWVGGLNTTLEPAVVETANFAPRATAPVLLLEGKLDFMVSTEDAERLYRFLGTPKRDKKLVFFDGGHIALNKDDLIKQTLDWYDRYLGPVAK
jgi:predicted esterase